jgi:hypothetical protein
MLLASAVFLAAAVAGKESFDAGNVETGPFVLTLAAFILLTVGGWLGGGVVFVHGMRVLNLIDMPARQAAAPVPAPEKSEAEGASRPRPRLPLSLDCDEAELGLERAGGLRADGDPCGLAVLEDHDRRDRDDPEPHRDLLLLVDVHLHDLELVLALVRDLLEHRSDGMAGATPLSPEVDDHWLIALDDLQLAGLGCHWGQSASFLDSPTGTQTQA